MIILYLCIAVVILFFLCFILPFIIMSRMVNQAPDGEEIAGVGFVRK